LPGVGQNLQDHATIIVSYACTKPVTIHNLQNPVRKAWAGARWLANRSGPATSNIWEAGGLVRSNPSVHYPNLQYHFAPVGVEYEGQDIRLTQAFSIHIDQLRPTSRGCLELATDNPSHKPLLHFDYLTTDHDRRELVEAVGMAREVIGQPAFDKFRGAECHPGMKVTSDADILEFVRNAAETDFHPCGTCRMGNDEMAVIDGEFKLRGVQGLRVVDASAMPRITSANLNAPIQMMAARAADFILGRKQLEPIQARFHFQN
jgi:choline dehydrogenase